MLPAPGVAGRSTRQTANPPARRTDVAWIRRWRSLNYHPELTPVLPHQAMLRGRSDGGVFVCCRPRRDGSRRFDRDRRFRSADQQLCCPASPGFHEALEHAKLSIANAVSPGFAKAAPTAAERAGNQPGQNF